MPENYTIMSGMRTGINCVLTFYTDGEESIMQGQATVGHAGRVSVQHNKYRCVCSSHHQSHSSPQTGSSETMLHSRLSATLLLAAACVLKTAASPEKVIVCGGNNVQRLSCDIGVISVVTANYGRLDNETCSEGIPPNQLANTMCSLAGRTDILRNRCNGKKVCELDTAVVRTSDPCPGTNKYLETTYDCLPAIRVVTCENSVAYLFCDEGQVMTVVGADYGRRDRTTCSYKKPASQTQNVTCSSPTASVAESCDGKQRCSISATNTVFGDPCIGTYKYLEVAYTCQYPDADEF